MLSKNVKILALNFFKNKKHAFLLFVYVCYIYIYIYIYNNVKSLVFLYLFFR